jgi:hypothetical protein
VTEVAEATPAAIPWRRLLITAAAVACFVLLQHIPAPLLDRDALERAGYDAVRLLSVGAIQLTPILSGFVLVELAAVLVPAWRRLRVEARAKLWRASVITSVVLALVQAFGLARYFETMRVGNDPIVTRQGIDLYFPLVATLVAGTCFSLAMAEAIEVFGIGRGFSWLLAASGAPVLLQTARTLATEDVTPAMPVATAVATAGAVLALTFRRGFRLPTCGLDPVFQAAHFVTLGTMSGLLQKYVLSEFPAGWDQGSVLFGIEIFIVLALCFGLSSLYNRDAPPDDRPALWGAIVRTAIFLVGFAVAQKYAQGVHLLAFTTAAAVALDVGAELRGRAMHGPLAPVLRSSKPDQADEVVRKLSEAGIPTVLRGAYHRSLLHFFGPYLPIDVLVPEARAAEAASTIALQSPPNV